jgi:glycosyltransferase involved in cell wall biosynthesis
MKDLYGAKIMLMFPVFLFKFLVALRRRYRDDAKNIIYNYGPPRPFNLGLLAFAKKTNFKIIFDIVEDYDFDDQIPRSIFGKINLLFIKVLVKKIIWLASGVVVASRHLYDKFERAIKGRIFLYYLPVSCDIDTFTMVRSDIGKKTTLFYSGSFGPKDGVITLLSAFELLAERHPEIWLVLTGRSPHRTVNSVLERIKISKFKERIEYKGYLSDDEYYEALLSSDIPCVTRVNTPYANAGFPFKLGEYLSTGKAVIVSKVSDVEIFLMDRANAMLVEPRDIGGIVSAVDYLMENPDEAVKIGMRGRETAQKYFDSKKQGQELLAYIRNL